MLVCWNCTFRHRYRLCNILHDVALASCLQKSVWHVALSYDTDDILLFIARDISGCVEVLHDSDSDDDSWKCWMLQFYHIDMRFFMYLFIYV